MAARVTKNGSIRGKIANDFQVTDLFRQLQLRVSPQHVDWRRALSLVCVVLTLFVATAQISHVHNASSRSADRNCSICSVAHSTAKAAVAFQHAPVFVRTATVAATKPSLRSFLSLSCLFIRPPPSV